MRVQEASVTVASLPSLPRLPFSPRPPLVPREHSPSDIADRSLSLIQLPVTVLLSSLLPHLSHLRLSSLRRPSLSSLLPPSVHSLLSFLVPLSLPLLPWPSLPLSCVRPLASPRRSARTSLSKKLPGHTDPAPSVRRRRVSLASPTAFSGAVEVHVLLLSLSSLPLRRSSLPLLLRRHHPSLLFSSAIPRCLPPARPPSLSPPSLSVDRPSLFFSSTTIRPSYSPAPSPAASLLLALPLSLSPPSLPLRRPSVPLLLRRHRPSLFFSDTIPRCLPPTRAPSLSLLPLPRLSLLRPSPAPMPPGSLFFSGNDSPQ